MDFLKHREGSMIFVSGFHPFSVTMLKNYIRGCVSLKKYVTGCVSLKK
jgi:hypothetical protein